MGSYRAARPIAPDNEAEFPTPPAWMVWVGRDRDKGGRLFNEVDLSKAKTRVAAEAGSGDRFVFNWSIYEWDFTAKQWVRRHTGDQRTSKKDHPLWAKSVKKRGAGPRPISDEEMASVMASLMADT